MNLEIGDTSIFTKMVSGSIPVQNGMPFAMCYGGHQFGNWAGQLGDGRAINIADFKINNESWKFQLKGSGPTPYSRSADGFAVLRSSIREYLCSEAMHFLRVPTTRALSLVTTGDSIERDVMYNGNPAMEQGAVVCRTAPSFIRFGSFEIHSSRNNLDLIKELADYTIKHHYPELGAPSKETYAAFFNEVAIRTRKMIVDWQRVGFVHGVMNTDNMSILGLTIDYGPYGWLENFDPTWTPNTTDRQNKRYRFENQPNIALWNLYQLANALYPLIDESEPFEKVLKEFQSGFQKDYQKMMLEKIGLFKSAISEDFIKELTDLMVQSDIDMTIFYRKLSDIQTQLSFNNLWEIILDASYKVKNELEDTYDSWNSWFSSYLILLEEEGMNSENRMRQMKEINPKSVLRNDMAQLAMDASEKGDHSFIDVLYHLLKKPYDDHPEL
jgi:uncharacterized protein YdiU (UPF0061 family)